MIPVAGQPGGDRDGQAMRWVDFSHGEDAALASAREIVAWVEREGGSARYDVGHPEQYDYPGPTIAVRGQQGDVHCEPGQWVVRGEMVTVCEHGYSPATCRNYRHFREFTVESR